MLGYVRTDTPELRVRDQECYRALYCGLCRHMGKCTGQCSRMALSYDFVFLAAFRMSLLQENVKIKQFRCLAHPTQRKNAVADSATLAFCADATAILTYHKCLDDVADEKGFKRIRAKLAAAFFHSGYRRAKKRYAELDRTVCNQLKELRQYEQNSNAPPSADAPAAIFGNIMSAVCSEGLSGGEKRIAAQFGRAIGHWIYLIDAADDYRDDLKSGSFNPFTHLFGSSMTEENAAGVKLALKKYLTDAENAFVLIDDFPMPEIKEILCNILYLGLPATADRILNKTWKGEPKEK